VLLEWFRVLAIGGNLVLYLPDEQKYRMHCRNTGQERNYSHKIDNFNLDYIKKVLSEISNVEIIHEEGACEEYSFEIVLRKTGPTEKVNLSREEKEDEIDELKKTLIDKDNQISRLKKTISDMKNARGWRMLESLRKRGNRFLTFRK
jgi:predicted RNase H-like nuclease (RuvC/YqgF family)